MEEKPKKKRKVLRIILLSIGSLLGTIVLIFGIFLIYASATTLKVQDRERMKVRGNLSQTFDSSISHNIMTWNVGYCALDEYNDFYMDGGKNSLARSEKAVKQNLNAIKDKISEIDPDLFFIQEIDVDSHRSFNVNELKSFRKTFDEEHYEYSFASNFKAGYIPIPISNPLGGVYSGIATYSKYHSTEATRIQLPIPFKWPVKLLNLKRCLLVNRLPIDGSDKELVLVNLHLEAYSDNAGKIKQLKMLMKIFDDEVAKGNYVIAGGDFNQTFSNIDLEKYDHYNDWVPPIIDVTKYPNTQFVMDDRVPTCRSLNKPYHNTNIEKHVHYMLDGFIVSNNITVNSFETIDLGFVNTDHNPVVMNFTLN